MPVVGYKTDVLPAFYTRASEFPLQIRADKPETVADMLHAKWDLGLQGGAVIANPIPEADAMEESFINGIIKTALDEANANGIAGKDVTPFMLGKVKELTDGKSLDANIALVKHNAVIGAQIAVAFNRK